jgi:hypothetical protein
MITQKFYPLTTFGKNIEELAAITEIARTFDVTVTGEEMNNG